MWYIGGTVEEISYAMSAECLDNTEPAQHASRSRTSEHVDLLHIMLIVVSQVVLLIAEVSRKIGS